MTTDDFLKMDIYEEMDIYNELEKAVASPKPQHIETVRVAGGKDHPTYAGVLDKAHKMGLTSIETKVLQFPKDDNNWACVVHARVIVDGKVFEAIGDATPSNVNAMIKPHLIRMAETRAKGRALRDAVNIAQALKEEIE
jgi:hypothetical protein